MIEDQQIYGRVFINGIQQTSVSASTLSMISSFLTKSGLREAVYRHQAFSSLSLEFVHALYAKVQPLLAEEDTREQ